jgi:hypothetical protein
MTRPLPTPFLEAGRVCLVDGLPDSLHRALPCPPMLVQGQGFCQGQTNRGWASGRQNHELTPIFFRFLSLRGSNRSGVRQLYVMPAEGGAALPITRVERGHAAMWAYWQAETKR